MKKDAEATKAKGGDKPKSRKKDDAEGGGDSEHIKRPKSSFFIFVDDFRPTFKAENPDAKQTEIVKAASEKWKSMDDSEKKPFNDEAAKLKAEYDLVKPPAAKKAKKGADGEDKPKRPPSAYFIFAKEFRPTWQAENPDVRGITECSKATAAKWNAMSDSEKQPYKDEAAKLKAEHDAKK